MMYLLLNHRVQEVFGEYKNQDRLLGEFYNLYRLLVYLSDYTLLYVDENEQEWYMSDGKDMTLLRWLNDVSDLAFLLRVKKGTDIIGLHEFVEASGIYVTYTELANNPNEILYNRYHCFFDNTPMERGATKLEALARSLLKE